MTMVAVLESTTLFFFIAEILVSPRRSVLCRRSVLPRPPPIRDAERRTRAARDLLVSSGRSTRPEGVSRQSVFSSCARWCLRHARYTRTARAARGRFAGGWRRRPGGEDRRPRRRAISLFSLGLFSRSLFHRLTLISRRSPTESH